MVSGAKPEQRVQTDKRWHELLVLMEWEARGEGIKKSRMRGVSFDPGSALSLAAANQTVVEGVRMDLVMAV